MKEVPFFSKVSLMKSMDIFFTSLISPGAERSKQKNINAAQFQRKRGPRIQSHHALYNPLCLSFLFLLFSYIREKFLAYCSDKRMSLIQVFVTRLFLKVSPAAKEITYKEESNFISRSLLNESAIWTPFYFFRLLICFNRICNASVPRPLLINFFPTKSHRFQPMFN